MTQNQHIYAIYGGPEVAGDVNSCHQNVKTIRGYLSVNYEVACSSSFWENIPKNQFVMAAADIDDNIKWKCFLNSGALQER